MHTIRDVARPNTEIAPPDLVERLGRLEGAADSLAEFCRLGGKVSEDLHENMVRRCGEIQAELATMHADLGVLLGTVGA